jgi:hypothetical protein
MRRGDRKTRVGKEVAMQRGEKAGGKAVELGRGKGRDKGRERGKGRGRGRGRDEEVRRVERGI